jgi:hypothetical protein
MSRSIAWGTVDNVLKGMQFPYQIAAPALFYWRKYFLLCDVRMSLTSWVGDLTYQRRFAYILRVRGSIKYCLLAQVVILSRWRFYKKHLG